MESVGTTAGAVDRPVPSPGPRRGDDAAPDGRIAEPNERHDRSTTDARQMTDDPRHERPAPAAENAFADLFRSEHPRLVALVTALTGDRALAEDVAQEALLRAFREWDRIADYERPGAWVRRVAVNLATSAGRRRRSERRALTRVAARPQPTADDPAANPSDLWARVRDLPARQATALVLFYVGDASVADVARTMECAEGTAKALLHQGRTALAARLDAPGDGRETRTDGDGEADAAKTTTRSPADPEVTP